MKELPDIQETKPKINIPIKQVGVENMVVPFQLELREGGFCQLNANVSMRTNLDANTKGISMSRLLLTLKPYLAMPLKHKLIKEILDDLKREIGSTASYMKFEFRMPVFIKKSIISDHQFPIYYDCVFEGQMYQIKDVQESGDINHPLIDKFRFYQGVKIQYASYCPCSAALCEDLEKKGACGYPHNQRSFADVLIETVEPNYVWLEDVIELVENNIKTLPYPIIKRVDEQEIARIAAENPLFVEDAIRIISEALNSREDIYDWIVKCIHEESIHTHEAIAINYKGLPGGFDGKRFL